MYQKTLLAVFLFLSVTSQAQMNDDSLFIRRLADTILTSGTAYENLRQLTKDIGHRLAGSPQMYASEKWGAAALEKAGSNKVWMQDCMVPHWVRGKKEQVFLIAGNKRQPMEALSLGNSVGTNNKALEAPLILVNSFEELDSLKEMVKGKIVFYNYKFNPRFIRTFHSYGDAVKYRVDGASRAARYGALAVIIRSVSHAADNHPHTGTLRYQDSFPKIPALAIGLKDADRLASILDRGNARLTIRSEAKMLPDTIGHNVIGELRGSEFPDEFITVGGHLDSWDTGEGAHDDGAGCVQSIEVLRALKAVGYTPRRTIRVVLFANEENGLRGGTAYAGEAKNNKEKHYFALESDAGGFTPRGFGFAGAPAQLEKLRSWIPLLLPYGVYKIENGGGGADIGPLHRELNTPMAGLEPDTQRYFDYHHAPSDVFEAVNKRELELGALNMAALIYLIDKYGL